MNIEIKSVRLAPGYFTGFEPKLANSLLDAAIADKHVRSIVYAAAMSNRGPSVFEMLMKHKDKITATNAAWTRNIVANGQSNDEDAYKQLSAYLGSIVVEKCEEVVISKEEYSGID